MAQYISSPNMIIIYDFADARGDFHSAIELVGDEATYPGGWTRVPADVYFSFDPDDAYESGDPTTSFAQQMEEAGYVVDENCATGEIGAVLHVVNTLDEHQYTVFTKTGAADVIYDDEMFSIEEALDDYESMPVAWDHDWWYISESY